jgi:predicted  nucleic acid-binding Zn-ribbon protein
MGKTQKLVDKEKGAFEKTMGNIKRLTEDINGFVKKFDAIKEEIDMSNKKYESYKMEMETKKQQVALLETQIQNIILMGQLKDKTKNDIQEERAQIKK